MDEDLQKSAREKAISAYDQNDAWGRSTDMAPDELKFYAMKIKRENNTLIKLDSHWVDVTKVLQDGSIIGKSRLTPRGFDDRNWESQYYSSSPTVSSVAVRTTETLGLRLSLIGVVIDFSSASANI